MPACSTDNFPRFVRSNSDMCGSLISKSNGSSCCSPRHGSSPMSPSSPLSTSPRLISPISTLRRSMSSTFSLIPEERPPTPTEEMNEDDHGIIYKLMTWFPFLVLNKIQRVINFVLTPAWGQMLVVIPTLWIAAWLWMFWKSIQCPLSIVKWFLTIIFTSSSERNRKKKTVVISGGSTIQALHLARNFYCSGNRVVVIEIDGLFGLAKFSTAVDKFYTVPKPSTEDPQQYVRALCNIIETEKANYYVPVCATSSAYFDAIAKPQLEALGCSCFVPSLRDVTFLDDIAEIMHCCQEMTKPTPLYTNITSKEDVHAWYEDKNISHNTKYFMASTGLLGIKDRIKFIMPAAKKDFRLNREISEDKPWVIVQDMPGEHFLTCTTIKDSQVVANVTCKIDQQSKGLVHELNKEIEVWLKQFFTKLSTPKTISGHVSFRFVKESTTGIILPLGAKVGVSLPYISHTSVHPKLLWRSCPHFNKQKSGPIVAAEGSYWMHEAVLSTLRHPGLEAVTNFIGTVLDKREALFVFWDPLPYCAYYQLQLPFSSVLGYTQKTKSRENIWLNTRRASQSTAAKMIVAH